MAKISGLGRGLDAIFIDNETKNGSEKLTVRLSQIEPNRTQPRTEFDKKALEELAESISIHGVLQPILIRPVGDGFYSIIAGERRWRASKMAGLTEIPAIVVDADEKKTAEIALIENLQREDLNAIEEAKAYKTLMDEHTMTQEEIAKRIGKSRSAVANTLRLLELPESVLTLVTEKTLTAGHARALLGIAYKEDLPFAVQRVTGRGLSVRSTEELVKTLNAKKREEDKESEALPNVDYAKDLERRVAAVLGRSFKLTRRKGVNVCEIAYTDSDDLQELLVRLCGKEFVEE